MKYLVVILVLVALNSHKAWAQLKCSQVYHQTHQLTSTPTPVIGLIVEMVSGSKKLLIGPYMGEGHIGLLETAVGLGGIKKILWGGELMMSYSSPHFIIHKANETSGLVNEINADPKKFATYYPFFKDVQAQKSDVAELLAFGAQSRIQFSKDYRGEKFDPQVEHLYTPFNKAEGNNRHAMGNDLQTASTTAYILSMGKPLKGVLAENFTEIFQKVSLMVRAYLDTRLTEVDPVMEEMMQQYLADIASLDPKIEPHKNFSPEKWAEMNRSIDAMGRFLFKNNESPY